MLKWKQKARKIDNYVAILLIRIKEFWKGKSSVSHSMIFNNTGSGVQYITGYDLGG